MKLRKLDWREEKEENVASGITCHLGDCVRGERKKNEEIEEEEVGEKTHHSAVSPWKKDRKIFLRERKREREKMEKTSWVRSKSQGKESWLFRFMYFQSSEKLVTKNFCGEERGE